MKNLCEGTLGPSILMVTTRTYINTMSLVKRPLCYPRKPFTGGTPAPKNPVPPGEGRLSNLLTRIGGEAKMIDNSWRPIADLDNHVRICRLRARTLEDHTKIQKLINRHEEYYAENPRPEKPVVVEEPVLSSVVDDDHPLAKITSRDISDEETITIYQAAGYSEDFLNNLRKKYENKRKIASEKDAYLDKVLANYPGKSTTKPKKTKLRSRFATMMRNKNVIKLSDLEDDKVKEEDGENEKEEGEGEDENEM